MCFCKSTWRSGGAIPFSRKAMLSKVALKVWVLGQGLNLCHQPSVVTEALNKYRSLELLAFGAQIKKCTL